MKETIEEILAASATPGAAVALWVEGEPLFKGGVGHRDVEQSKVLPEDARFYIYSITKVMIAVAVLQLVEAGRLGLDEAIRRSLPALPIAEPLTVRQLLNHSGGLPDYGGLPAYTEAVHATPRRPWTREQFLANILGSGLLYAPGQGWAYSNIGYMLLVMLLERQHGLSLREILQRQIFAPLGLGNTYVADSLEGAEALTPGYTTFFGEEEAPEDMRFRYHPGWVAHGVVVSTAGELALFLQRLFDGRLLGAPLLDEMCQPVFVPGRHRHFKQAAYGLGLMLDLQSPYGLAAGHGGGGPGYSTAALYCADVNGRAVVSVALANRDQGDVGLEIAFGMVEALAASG